MLLLHKTPLGAILAAVVVAVTVTVAPPVAVGQDDPFANLSDEEALELLGVLDEADAARDRGDWQAALEGYRIFLARVPDDFVRLEVARALEALGDAPGSAETYQGLIASDEDEVAAAARDELQALRSAYAPTLTISSSTPRARAVVRSEDGDERRARVDEPIELHAGRWEIEVSANDHQTHTETIELVLGDDAVRDVSLAPQAPVPLDEAPERARRSLAAPLVFGALAVGSFATAGAMYAESNSVHDQFTSYPDQLGATYAGWTDLADDGERYQRVGHAMLGVGGAFTIATVIALVARSGPEDEAARLAAPRLAASGAGVGLTW